jgi:four helix bundle protein
MRYKGYRDLKVYKLAYQLAMDIYAISRKFPKEEKFSLTDQITRSSRSVPANIAEAWHKRHYIKMFVNKIVDASGEAGETEVWLDFACDCKYITREQHTNFKDAYAEVNRMLFGMISKPERFVIKQKTINTE